MTSNIPMTTTLALLDASDHLAQEQQAAWSEAELARHLQAVSGHLGRVLSDDQAKAAVAHAMQPAPMRPSALAWPKVLDWGRPETPDALHLARRKADHDLQRTQTRLAWWRERARIWGGRCLASVVGGGTLGLVIWMAQSGANVPGLLLGGVVGLALILMVVGIPLMAVIERLEPLVERRLAFRATHAQAQVESLAEPAELVTLADVRTWMTLPGIGRALHALATGTVPFLSGDVARLNQALEDHHQALAEQARQRQIELEAAEETARIRQADYERQVRAGVERAAIATYLDQTLPSGVAP